MVMDMTMTFRNRRVPIMVFLGTLAFDDPDKYYLIYVCVRFLSIHSGHQVRWTYQTGSHRTKVTQDISSTVLLLCVP